jgi:hypothetical protein
VSCRFGGGGVFGALAASSRDGVSAETVRERTRNMEEVRAALERLWPVLTPAQLLHDLFGSKALLRLAGSRWLTDAEVDALYRPRAGDIDEVRWSEHDAGLLDEAREVLGPRVGRPGRTRGDGAEHTEEIRTYGHIVIDEVLRPPVPTPRVTGTTCSATSPIAARRASPS